MVAALYSPPSLPGFVPVPDIVRFNRGIPHGAQILCGVLDRRARRFKSCCVALTQGELCREVDRADGTVRAWLKALRAAGILSWTRRGQGISNVYVLHYLQDVFPNRTARWRRPRTPREVADQEPQEAAVPLREEDGREGKGGFECSKTLAPVSLVGDDATAPDASADPPAHRPTARSYDPDRARIATLVLDLRRDLHDTAPATATVTRAVGLFRRAEVDLDTFATAVYEARAITQERSGGIRSVESESGRKRKMGYFFACLQDRLSPQAAHEEGPPGWARATSLATTPSIDAPDAPTMDASPPQPWPEELSALGIHDRIGYYHAVRSFPPRDPVAAIELARRRRGARGGTPSPDGPSRPSRR